MGMIMIVVMVIMAMMVMMIMVMVMVMVVAMVMCASCCACITSDRFLLGSFLCTGFSFKFASLTFGFSRSFFILGCLKFFGI
jgi:hypothetical protein